MRAFISILWAAVALAQTSVDSYIATQGPISKAGLLANIGPSGSKSQGAKAGIVIASPSTNPNYIFTWTRDTSLVFKVLIDQFVTGRDTTLLGQIQNFVSSQQTIQQVSNPSGTISTGGLGEPHYNIDETAFTAAWGRPQRDGPALRATAMIEYANFLLKNGSAANVASTLWPTIKLDLDYVVADWNQSTFDFWEEVSSSSFFTTAVQHRSLREGATLATALGQPASVAATYTTQAANLLCFLQSYWNPAGGYMTANTGGGRSGKDANTVLTSIHTFDPAAGCDSVTFQPCSDRALSNLKVYVDAFRTIYAVNSGIASNAAAATGRYPEDSYFGGNPWYLATAAVAEQLYDALIVWNDKKQLNVTSTSLAFFQQFLPSVTAGTYASTTTTYTTLITSIKTFADGFIGVIAKFTPAGGSLSEQYSRSNGAQTSAADLTWSYAAMLSAFDARNGVKPPSSWGAAGLVVPSVCQTSTGTPTATVAVTFNVVATTVPGENIFITGNQPSLQNWSPDNALLLSAANFPTWSIVVNVPASSDIQYKYIRKLNGAITWEADPNNEFQSPAGGSLTRNDVWNGAAPSGGGTVAVTFNVVATTFFGENIYITGSINALENWSTDNALLLSSANFPTWSITINVPSSTAIEYKYIRKVNGVFESWEGDPNNAFTSPASGTATRNDQWR